MTMQTDVKSAALTGSGSVFAGPARVKAVCFSNAGTASSFVLKDGGTSGTARLTINTPAAAGFHTVNLPAEGILFSTNVYATFTDANVAAITVFYG